MSDQEPQETPQTARPLLSDELGAWKGKRTHKNLGDVFITVECLAMQLQNPDPTSIFVEHNGEIKEVSRSMMVAPNYAANQPADEREKGTKP